MSRPKWGDALSRKYYETVILRLVLSRPRGHGSTLEYGEVVDHDGKPHSKFVGWHGLLPAVQDFVMSQRDEDE